MLVPKHSTAWMNSVGPAIRRLASWLSAQKRTFHVRPDVVANYLLEGSQKQTVAAPQVPARLHQRVTRTRTLDPSTRGEVHSGYPEAVHCGTVEDAPSRRDRLRGIGVPDHRPVRMRHL